MEKQKGKREYLYVFISFLICLLPRLLFLGKVYPMSIAGDESFMFMPAASLAGLDWTGNAQNYRYYGYGFVVLLTPFFKLVKDPVLLYRIFVSFMILSQALVGPIAYHLTKKYFSLKNSMAALLISICSSYLVFLRAVYVYNEFIYDLVVWLIVWCFLELLRQREQKQKKVFYTALLMLLLTYEMTIHSRGITLWLALGVTVVFFGWVYRTCIISLPVLAVAGTIGYFFSQKGIDYVVQMFTNAASSSEVSNTAVSFSVSSLFSSAKAGIGWFFIVLGQINSMVLVTGGVAVIGMIFGCFVLWRALFRKKDIVETDETGKSYVLVLTFGLAASGITILGQSFSWLQGVAESIELNQATDAMRAVTYLRYYGIYFVPIFMLSLIWMYQNGEKLKKILFPLSLTFGILQVFWVVFIVPYITGYNGTSWEFNPFSFTKGWEDTIRIRVYLPAVVFAAVFLGLFLFLVNKKKWIVALVFMNAVLFYTYGFSCLYHEGQRGEINYSYIDRSYDLFRVLEAADKEPESLYVEDWYFPETGQSLVSESQFVFKQTKIVPELPDVSVKEGIFITGNPKENQRLLQQGFLFAQIDENEYWYVKGEEVLQVLDQEGVVFTPYMKNHSSVGLNQFLSDVKIPGNGFSYMDSTGEEGYFLYGYGMPISQGKVEFNIQLQLFSYESEEIGVFELWIDGEKADEIIIEGSMADESGDVSFSCSWKGTDVEELEPRIYLNQGSCVRVTEVSFKR